MNGKINRGQAAPGTVLFTVAPCMILLFFFFLPVFAAFPQPGGVMSYDKWKTVPVGRYLVDVPEKSDLTWYLYVHDKPVEKLRLTPEQAQKQAQDKIRELKNARHNTQGPMFIKMITLPDDGLIIYAWTFEFNTMAKDIHMYKSIKTEDTRQIYYYTDTIPVKKEAQLIPLYEKTFANLKALPKGQMPPGPAFCAGDIMIEGEPTALAEEAAVKIQFPNVSGMNMSFKNMSSQFSAPPLHQRENVMAWRKKNLQGGKNYTTLRAGMHPAGGVQGSEVCLAADADTPSFYRMYTFYWDISGRPGDPSQPLLRATLSYRGPDSGKPPVRPFSTDKEALKVWDRFVDSIKKRQPLP